MYKVSTPKDVKHVGTPIGSPAPGTTKQAAGGATSAKSPAMANRRVAVPPLNLAAADKKPVVTSPDSSPPSTPTRSRLPSPSTSPRKVLRSISEKASAVKARVESAVSPRARMAKALEGVEWTDLDAIPTPARPPSPESPPSRKRKAAHADDRGEAKKVRFDPMPQVRRDASSTSVPASSHMAQIDQLVAELGKPIGPPPRPKTPAPSELTPIKLPPGSALGTPSLHKHPANREPEDTGHTYPRLNPPSPAMPSVVSTPSGKKTDSDTASDSGLPFNAPLVPTQSLPKTSEAADSENARVHSKQGSSVQADSFPFAPDKLGKLAIRKRAEGKEWVGKASGQSLAATLQNTLDNLQANNADRIDKEACGYLQEIFALLPAGVDKASRTFNYMLMKSFYSLGLNHAQWNVIEQLHKDFDRLDTRHDPQGCAALKAQLGEIVSAKKGLLHLKLQAGEGTGNDANS